MDFLVPKWCREPLATLSKMDMQVCPLILCNFFQKGLAKNTITFFQEINENSYKLDNKLLQETKELFYYHTAKKNSKISLIYSIGEPILSQVKGVISDTVRSIKVAVPYYDNQLLAYKKLIDEFKNAKVTLYIQNEKSTFPVKYNEENKFASDIVVFKGFNDGTSGSGSNFYHGKVFLFKTDTKAYVLYGSSNCTLAALTKTPSLGGNIECDLLEQGDLDEFDYFFNNIAAIDLNETFFANVLRYESEEIQIYSFKYGCLKNGEITLHFSFSKEDDSLEVFYQAYKLVYKIIDNELIVFIDEALAEIFPNVFELKFSFKDGEENQLCWIYSETALSLNRIKQSDKQWIGSFDPDSTGDKFCEDRMNILKAEMTCRADVQEYNKTMAYYNQIKQEQEGDDADSEDYIVEVEIPDEYRIAEKKYRDISGIRNIFFKRFISIRSNDAVGKDYEPDASGNQSKSTETGSCKPRKATPYEKQFERFVKRRVRGMLEDTYVEIIETKHYIGLAEIIFSIFDKYNREENVEDIFDSMYVVKTKAEFLTRILSKSIEEEEKDELEPGILDQCFVALVNNYLISLQERDQDIASQYLAINKNLLKQIEKRFHVRTIYLEHVKILYEKRVFKKDFDISGFGGYVERLYGYKSYELLEQYIAKEYENANLEIQDKRVLITATAEEMIKHIKPNTNVLREIKKYSNNVQKVDNVTITVNNSGTKNNSKSYIDQIKHSIRLNDNHCRSTTTWSNGRVEESKSTYISY